MFRWIRDLTPNLLTPGDAAPWPETLRPLQVRGHVFAPIPRILHQTWNTSEIPAKWRGYQSSWLENHPSWQYVLWTADDHRRLIAERHSWFLPTYDAFPRHIQRVDAAKYFILYTYGGCYADLDCECLKPVDAFLEQGGVVVGKTRDGVIGGAFFASPSRHPLWELVFDEMQAPSLVARICHRMGYEAAYVLFSTGPRMLKRVVRRYVDQRAKESGSSGITIWGPEYFFSHSWLRRYVAAREPGAFLHHHYSGSWLSPMEAAVHQYFTVRTLKIAAPILAALILLSAISC